MTIRPRRSVLYMPGSNARAIEKARTLPVDGVILDLEDAVAPEAKEQARTQVADAVKAGGFGGREVFIRVNGIDTPWHADDLAAAAHAAPDAHPGAEDFGRSTQLERVGQRLLDMKTDLKTRVWAMIETPDAIFNIKALAAEAHDSETRLAGFVMGTNDLAKETRARLVPGRAPMVSWLATCVLAAHAHGIDILDGVYNDLSDAEGLRARMRAGARHGLRRQDADPSEPDRALQRGVLAERRRGRAGAQDDRRVRPAGEQGTRAWCRSTAAWSSACTPRWRAAPSRSRRRSKVRPPAERAGTRGTSLVECLPRNHRGGAHGNSPAGDPRTSVCGRVAERSARRRGAGWHVARRLPLHQSGAIHQGSADRGAARRVVRSGARTRQAHGKSLDFRPVASRRP